LICLYNPVHLSRLSYRRGICCVRNQITEIVRPLSISKCSSSLPSRLCVVRVEN